MAHTYFGDRYLANPWLYETAYQEQPTRDNTSMFFNVTDTSEVRQVWPKEHLYLYLINRGQQVAELAISYSRAVHMASSLTVAAGVAMASTMALLL